MKKYLMTGIAAVAMCAAFTSCSHDIETLSVEDQTSYEVEKIVKNYETAFQKVFGQPAPNHTWGFSDNYSGSTRSENPNANDWAKDGYMAPTELSEAQKIRVMAYFQANPGLTYIDPEFEDFFVQQVYKGGTTPGAISAEVYHATNGNAVVGSEHMDWLYMGLENGQPRQHINNFNHGRYGDENANDPNGLPRNNVQNWPGIDYLNDNGNGTHQDHIMLILGESTETVGFKDSEGSNVHLDCCANAGAEVIDAWAIAHKDSLEAIGKFGATVTDSRWNRSFVGLDYEQTTLDNLYSTWRGNAKALDFKDGNSQYILYQGNVYPASSFADFELKDVNGNNVRYVKDEVSNMAIADYIMYTKSDNTEGKVTKDAYNYKLTKQQFKDLYNTDITNSEAGLYNLDMILGYIRQSALPTNNDGNWVKNIGGRDYVFSDWIVTLTEANKQTITKTADLRVMAEDLSAGENAADFDFNDVVFDVYFSPNEGEAYVMVLAAGGTLPLTINGTEVHGLWDQPTNKMINTHAEDQGLNGISNLPAKKIQLTGITVNSKSEANTKIHIKVTKPIKVDGKTESTEIELVNSNAAACKVGVDPAQYPTWANERQNVNAVIHGFNQWVTNGILDPTL